MMETFDIKIIKNGKTFYYLKWIKGLGFIKLSKESYEYGN